MAPCPLARPGRGAASRPCRLPSRHPRTGVPHLRGERQNPLRLRALHPTRVARGVHAPEWPGFRHYAEKAGTRITELAKHNFPFTFAPRDLIDFVPATGP